MRSAFESRRIIGAITRIGGADETRWEIVKKKKRKKKQTRSEDSIALHEKNEGREREEDRGKNLLISRETRYSGAFAVEIWSNLGASFTLNARLAQRVLRISRNIFTVRQLTGQ